MGTTCKELVHKLGCKGPCTTRELLDVATNFAFGEEAVGAIFHNTKGKEKRQEDADEGGSSHNSKKKKKTKQSCKDPLVAADKCKNPRASPEDGLGVFDEMLEKPCPYHRGPVKHTLKECGMMKHYFSRGAQGKGDASERPEENKGNGKEKDNDFPIANNCFIIFSGPTAYDSRRQCKLEHRGVYATELAMPAFFDWFGSAITFNHDDHPDHVS
jgi:hypothetical protein